MTLKKIFTNIYSSFVGLALLGGFVVFLYMLIGFIIGGQGGADLMLFAKKMIVPRLYQLASIGVIAGMVLLYITNNHDLQLDKKNIEEK